LLASGGWFIEGCRAAAGPARPGRRQHWDLTDVPSQAEQPRKPLPSVTLEAMVGLGASSGDGEHRRDAVGCKAAGLSFNTHYSASSNRPLAAGWPSGNTDAYRSMED